MRILLLLPGVYLDSEEPQQPSLRAEPSQPEEEEVVFWLVRPGGGLEGAATDRAFGGRGTFHSSWAREELDAEPPPGDHFDSLGLAAGEKRRRVNSSCICFCFSPPQPSRLKRLNLEHVRKQSFASGETIVPEVLCAVLVREPLWLEARMDDQALLEGIVVFSDEDGPGRKRSRMLRTKVSVHLVVPKSFHHLYGIAPFIA